MQTHAAAAKAAELPPGCNIMRWYDSGAAGLYRKGVTPVPEGTLAGFMAPNGEQAFIVGEE